MDKKPFPKPFLATLEDGTRIEFCQRSHREGTIPPSFELQVRGPGWSEQDEFIGRCAVEVCAHGNYEKFRRFLVITAVHAKPFESRWEGDSFRIGGASFYPSERISYEVTMGEGGARSIKLPAHAFHAVRLEMLQTKPPGEMF